MPRSWLETPGAVARDTSSRQHPIHAQVYQPPKSTGTRAFANAANNDTSIASHAVVTSTPSLCLSSCASSSSPASQPKSRRVDRLLACFNRRTKTRSDRGSGHQEEGGSGHTNSHLGENSTDGKRSITRRSKPHSRSGSDGSHIHTFTITLAALRPPAA